MKKQFAVFAFVSAVAAFGLAGCGSSTGQLPESVSDSGEISNAQEIVPAAEETATLHPVEAAPADIGSAAEAVQPLKPAYSEDPTLVAGGNHKIDGLTAVIGSKDLLPETQPSLGLSPSLVAALNAPLEVESVDFVNSALIRIAFDRDFDRDTAGSVRLDAYTVTHTYVPQENKQYTYVGSVGGFAEPWGKDTVAFHPAGPLKGVTNLLAGEKTETTTITTEQNSPGLIQQNASPGAFSTAPGSSHASSHNHTTTTTITTTTPVTIVGTEGIDPVTCNTGTHCEAVIYVAKIAGYKTKLGKAMKEHSEATVRCLGANACLPCTDEDEDCKAMNEQFE